MERIVVAGETLVDFLPASVGPLSEVETFSRRAGGAPANVAVALARLERTPTFWTRVGEDPFGDFLADRLREEGLPDTLIERDADAKTGLAFVSLDDAADRAFSFYHEGAAETRMRPGSVRGAELDAVEWVHVDGLSMDARPARDAMTDLGERACDTGCTVSFDPNARPERWGAFDFPDSVRRAFEFADVVKATPEDLVAANVGEVDDPTAVDADRAAALARAVTDHGPHTALITVGAGGAAAHATADAPWVDGATTATHPGYRVDPVDTTGAGDAFTAGAIGALVDGEGVEEALAFANAVAAAATTAAGAMAALPDREAVAAFRTARE
jgi:fructokinase